MSVAMDVIVLVNSQDVPKLARFFGTNKDETDSAEPLAAISVSRKMQLISLLPKLTEQLAKNLPAYMIPSIFISLRHLPLTVSGNLDPKKLAQLGSALLMEQLAALTSVEAGRSVGSEPLLLTEMEARLSQLWAKIINVDARTTRATDNFFKIGADSINAIQLVRVADSDGVQLSTENIFHNPTLAAMSLAASTHSIEPKQLVPPQPFQTLKVKNLEVFLNDVVCEPLSVKKSEIEDILEVTDLQAWVVAGSFMANHG